jgi:hypothetical protein
MDKGTIFGMGVDVIEDGGTSTVVNPVSPDIWKEYSDIYAKLMSLMYKKNEDGTSFANELIAVFQNSLKSSFDGFVITEKDKIALESGHLKDFSVSLANAMLQKPLDIINAKYSIIQSLLQNDIALSAHNTDLVLKLKQIDIAQKDLSLRDKTDNIDIATKENQRDALLAEKNLKESQKKQFDTYQNVKVVEHLSQMAGMAFANNITPTGVLDAIIKELKFLDPTLTNIDLSTK